MRPSILYTSVLFMALSLIGCDTGTDSGGPEEPNTDQAQLTIGKDPVILSRSTVYYGFMEGQPAITIYSSSGIEDVQEPELDPNWVFLSDSSGYFESRQADTTCPAGGKLAYETDTVYDGHYKFKKGTLTIALSSAASYTLEAVSPGVNSGTWKATRYSFGSWGAKDTVDLEDSDTSVTVTLRNDSLIAIESWPYCFSKRFWKDGEEENDVTSYLDGCNSLALTHKDGRTMTYSLESITSDGRTEVRKVTYQGKSCLETRQDYGTPTAAQCSESWANYQAAPDEDYYWDDELGSLRDPFENCLDSIGVPQELVDRFHYYHD